MAEYKPKYGTATAFTITLTSVASSSTKVAGRSSAVVDNTTTRYDDALVSGYIKANNTAPTAGSLDVWVWAKHMDDTYPDTITGSDADITLTSADIRNAGLRLATTIVTDTTANRVYHVAPFSVAALFGGVMPLKWGVFVAHVMVQALNVTSGHALYYTGITYESV